MTKPTDQPAAPPLTDSRSTALAGHRSGSPAPIPSFRRWRARPDAARWLTLAIAAFVLHLLLSLLFADRGWSTSAGVIATASVALALSLVRARETSGALRVRWLLVASAFVLWMLGFAALAYHQVIEKRDSSTALPYDLFFVLRSVPWFTALVQTSDRNRWPHKQWCDWLQALLFAATYTLLLFPGLLGTTVAGTPEVDGDTVQLYRDLQNFLLAGLALGTIHLQPTQAERAFTRVLAALLTTYAVVACIGNRWLIDTLQPPPGSPLMLVIDLPLLVFILLVVFARDHAEIDGPIPANLLQRTLQQLSPAFLTLGTLLMAFVVATRHFWTGIALGVAGMLIYSTRSAMTQALYARSQRELTGARDDLVALAHRDPLTQLANRRRFDSTLRSEWRQHLHGGHGIALLFIDIDEFKAYNDTLGHRAGDACLRAVAELMRGQLRREGDLLARYGGEEFVAILPQIDAISALEIAQRLRKSVEAAGLPHPAGSTPHVTVSIGVAHSGPLSSLPDAEALLEAADRALYSAKSAGRNRVVAG